jgi:hypothetical protein
MIFKECLNMLALCILGFHYQERKGLGMVGWTKIQQKKTWPKVHFAVFIVCIVLTHDDDKMKSIHSLKKKNYM